MIRLASRHFLHKSFVNPHRPSRRENHIGVYVNTLRWASGKIDTESRIGGEQPSFGRRMRILLSLLSRKFWSLRWYQGTLLMWTLYVSGSSVIFLGSAISGGAPIPLANLTLSWIEVGAELLVILAFVRVLVILINKGRTKN